VGNLLFSYFFLTLHAFFEYGEQKVSFFFFVSKFKVTFGKEKGKKEMVVSKKELG